MARELGMNPTKLGKIANQSQEPWKSPFPLYIEALYLKRFKREKPEIVRSVEELNPRRQTRKVARKVRKGPEAADPG